MTQENGHRVLRHTRGEWEGRAQVSPQGGFFTTDPDRGASLSETGRSTVMVSAYDNSVRVFAPEGSGVRDVRIESAAVSSAVYSAMERAFSDGRVTTAELNKIKELRRTVAESAQDDGRFDAQEITAIRNIASQVAPSARRGG